MTKSGFFIAFLGLGIMGGSVVLSVMAEPDWHRGGDARE